MPTTSAASSTREWDRAASREQASRCLLYARHVEPESRRQHVVKIATMRVDTSREASALTSDVCARQQRKVTNWPAYDASLRQRGSLTVWFTEEAIAAWKAEPRTTRGGQPWYSPLAILTALTLRAVFRLAYRQTEGLIGSIIGLLGLDLPVPDHTTLSRRAATLEVPRPRSGSARCSRECRARASAGGQHGPEAVWARRVADRETWHQDAPVVAQSCILAWTLTPARSSPPR